MNQIAGTVRNNFSGKNGCRQRIIDTKGDKFYLRLRFLQVWLKIVICDYCVKVQNFVLGGSDTDD